MSRSVWEKLLVGSLLLIPAFLWGAPLEALAEVAGHEAEAGGGHGGPIVPVLLSLIVILLAAKIGGHFALKLKQPEVLGELVVGVIIGNLALIGIGGFEYLEHDAYISVLC